MNELFKLFGTISINGAQAEEELAKVNGSAEKTGGKIKSVFQGIAQGVGMYIGQMALNGVNQLGQFFNGVDNASGSMKSFAANMTLAGKSSSQIKQAQTAMEQYAQATVYNTTDMLQTVGLLSTSGVQNATDLAEAMGNVASAATDPEQALKSLSLQMTQVNGKGFIQTMDFRIMQEQASGPMKLVQEDLERLNNWSPAQFQDALSNGKISADMFNKALMDVGGASTKTGQLLQKNATTPKTFGQAWAVVTESLQNSLIPVMEKLQGIFIPMITNLANLAGTASGVLGKGISVAISWVTQLWNKLRENGAITYIDGLFKNLYSIGSQVVGMIKQFFSAVSGGSSSKDVLNGIAGAIQSVSKFLMNASGDVTLFLYKLKNTGAITSLGDAFKGVIGIVKDIISIIGNLFSSFTAGAPSAKSAIDMIVSSIKNVFSFINQGVSVVKSFFDAFSKSKGAIDGVKTALVAIGTAMIAWKGYITFWNLIIKAQVLWNSVTTAGRAIWVGFNAVIAANPIGTILTLIAALVAGLIYFFTQTKTGQKIWQDFMSWLKTAWQGVSTFFVGLWNGIVQIFNSAVAVISGVVGKVVSFLSSAFNVIKIVVQTAMNIVWSIIQIVWQLIKVTIEFVVGGIVAYYKWAWGIMSGIIQTAMNFISGVISTVWNAIWGFLQPILSAIANFFSSVWNGITSAVSSAVNSVSSVILSVWNAIWGFLQPILSAIGSFISSVWNGIKSTVSGVVNAIRSAVSSAWNAVSSTTSSVFNTVHSIASSVWNGIKSTISSVVNSIMSVVSSVWNSIRSVVSSVSSGISGTVSSIWNGLKGIVSGAMNGVMSTVSGILNTIKGLFNFHLSFPKISIPHIPLPHFSISGDFNPLKGQIPSIGVDWYAKGGIMTDPAMFGMNGNNAMVGGEAGPEAILPLNDKTLGGIGKGISDQLNVSGIVDKLDQVLQAIQGQNFNPKIVMNNGALVGEVINDIDRGLGNINNLRGRGGTF